MASRQQRETDGAFGGASPSLDGLPSFFTNGSVDDQKYESLLEDLRAHDLLGPADGGDDAAGFGTSSLFFNNAFSAVFMGNFSDSTGASSVAKAGTAAKPPPGFVRAPPGLAPTETDLKWARGQQTFSRLEGQYKAQGGVTASSPGGGRDVDLLDEIPSLKALGLDDDEAETPVKTTAPVPPPAPSTIPPPPGAWKQQLPPPPPPPPMPGHQHGQQQPPLPPPPPPGVPPGMQPPYPPHPMQQMHMPPPYGMRGPPPPHMPPHMHMQMRGPPPPPGAPGGHMPFPPPPMMMAPPPMQPAPRFKMMAPRDINYVMQMHNKLIRSSDPFSDDYYFHNFVQKRSRVPAPRPGGRTLPLPSWKLEHVKFVDKTDDSRAAKSREWETQNNVLGRNNTNSLYRPKKALNLSSDAAAPAATETAESTEEQQPKPSTTAETMVVKTQKQVFAGELWNKRHEIDRGFHCLLSLQDARHLLDARGINVQQFHSMDEASMDPALAELRARTTRLLLELAGTLGVVVGASQENTCDVAQLQRIVSISKGKRLVSRALPLLHPSARFVLLPALVEFLLAAPSMAKVAADGGNDEEDERLCQTIVLMLLYHPPPPSADVLTDCLTRVMAAHDVQTLRVLLYNRGRAEALQALLQRGGASIDEATSDETKLAWARAQEAFVTLATIIKQSA